MEEVHDIKLTLSEMRLIVERIEYYLDKEQCEQCQVTWRIRNELGKKIEELQTNCDAT